MRVKLNFGKEVSQSDTKKEPAGERQGPADEKW